MDNSSVVVSERAPSLASRPSPAAASRDESGPEVQATREGHLWGNFHLATVMFLRAVQLKQGARPRVETGGHKLVQIAFLEVTAGAVTWETSHARVVDDRR
jgi:hypothetical protein